MQHNCVTLTCCGGQRETQEDIYQDMGTTPERWLAMLAYASRKEGRTRSYGCLPMLSADQDKSES